MSRIFICFFILISLLCLPACGSTITESIPVIQKESSPVLNNIIANSKTIEELYYEEKPVYSYYSGGIKIVNTSQVWLKDNVLKTEQITDFYKNDTLIDREISGRIFDYKTLNKKHYCLGKYAEQKNLKESLPKDTLIVPRDQTILWYLDRVIPDLSIIGEADYEGEKCLVVEILKNNLGSTKLWISKKRELPVKVENNYNGNISVREYCNFKVGKDSVSNNALEIPKGAVQF
ncbi:MAG: outer membrane lipoprotein-sorting protein [Peptococcaceae bacterium]|nr:outer membrane lipoprotein-sorting protein [Peptococcaceae bacterium]